MNRSDRQRPLRRTLDKTQAVEGQHTYRGRHGVRPVVPGSAAPDRLERQQTWTRMRRGWQDTSGKLHRRRRQALRACRPGALPVLVDESIAPA